MVTFVCENCDSTLKKNQIERHLRGCYGYPRLSCIDCSKVFQGDEHKGHISCISEFEKHHGQYYKPKEKKLKTEGGPEVAAPESDNKKQVNSANTVKPVVNAPTEKNTKMEESLKMASSKSQWKGWKTTIRTTLKQKEAFTMKLNILKKNVIKEFLESHPDVKEMDAEAIFNEKIKNKKFRVEEKQKQISYVPRGQRL